MLVNRLIGQCEFKPLLPENLNRSSNIHPLVKIEFMENNVPDFLSFLSFNNKVFGIVKKKDSFIVFGEATNIEKSVQTKVIEPPSWEETIDFVEYLNQIHPVLQITTRDSLIKEDLCGTYKIIQYSGFEITGKLFGTLPEVFKYLPQSCSLISVQKK